MKGGNMTRKNKKGLSTIIATLLIILLTLVSVGIIWVVIRNVVQGGTNQVSLSQKCVNVALSAVTVLPTANFSAFQVTLKRGSDSEGSLGVKLNVFGPNNNSGVGDFAGFSELTPLGTLTKTIISGQGQGLPFPNVTVSGAVGTNKIEFTAYFRDASGVTQLCSQTNTFTF